MDGAEAGVGARTFAHKYYTRPQTWVARCKTDEDAARTGLLETGTAARRGVHQRLANMISR